MHGYHSKVGPILAVLVVAGCARSGLLKHCCPAPIANGTVYTGGSHAVQRALEVPPEGLLLTDAVEAALRPGVAISVAEPTSASTAVGSPVGNQSFQGDELLEAAVSRFKPAVSATSMPSGLIIDALKLFSPSVNQAVIDTELKAANNAGIFRAGTDVEMRDHRARQRDLIIRLKAIAFFGDVWLTTAPADKQLDAVVQTISQKFDGNAWKPDLMAKTTDIQAALKGARNAGLFVKAADEKAVALLNVIQPFVSNRIEPAPAAKVTTAISRVNKEVLAVTVSRRGARRYVLPLEAVRTTALGDIRLEDGDQVEIGRYEATPPGQPFQTDVNVQVVLADWTSNEKNAVDFEGLKDPTLAQLAQLAQRSNPNTELADVLVVKRISDVGGIDEVMIPLAATDHLNGTFLRPADYVRYDRMELTTLVRQSRAKFGAKAATQKCCPKVAEKCKRGIMPLPTGMLPLPK